MLKSIAAAFAILAATLAVVLLNPLSHDDQNVALYLGSGSYGDDSISTPSDRGVVFDSRTETPAYDGTHNVANFGIQAGSVDPECAVLPRKKCLPANLAEWRHGSPLPKKYALFVQALNKKWGGPEADVPASNPGSKEARFFFQQAKGTTQVPPWDHPNEAAEVFAGTPSSNAQKSDNHQASSSISASEMNDYDSAHTASGGQSLKHEDTKSDSTNGDDNSDASIQQMREEISKLKEEVRRAKERRELERRTAKLQAELRRMNSGEDDETESGAAGMDERCNCYELANRLLQM
jgi:hypothetical protein